MPQTPYVIERFGGLNVRDDPMEIGTGGAIDLLNVDLDRGGRVRARDGWAAFATAATASVTINQLIPSPSGPRIYAAYWASPNYVFEGFDSSGSSVATRTATGSSTATTPSYANLGTSSSALTYVTIWDASANYTCQRIASGSIAAGTGKPAFVAVTPVSNRLVEANFDLAASSPSGANGSRSTVFWSDAGDPQTFGANNFVTLRPNDGEDITGMVTWRDYTFVSKQSSLFIFYGESADATGNPIFNYRRVGLPAPIWRSTGLNRSPMVAAGEFGVFISTANGIYRTTGDTPVLVSGKVQDLFSFAAIQAWAFDGNPPILAWANGRLFATYSTASGSVRTLVYDPRIDEWMLWSNLGSTGVFINSAAGAYSASPGTSDFQKRIFFPLADRVKYTDPTVTTDGGTAIAWSWTSGSYAPVPGRVVVVPETSVVGSGTITIQLFSDNASSAVQTSSVTVVSTGVPAYPPLFDQEGRWLRLKLAGAGGGYVNQVTHFISYVKPAGLDR
jgi:hypothetical protein